MTWTYPSKTSVENPLDCEDNTVRILENNEIRLIEDTGVLWDNLTRHSTTWSQELKKITSWSSPATS